MLEAIPPGDIDLGGATLVVRYRADPEQPDLLRVSLLSHRTEGEPARIRKCELRCILIGQAMTRDAMHARVQVEAKHRGIARVAWIEEPSVAA